MLYEIIQIICLLALFYPVLADNSIQLKNPIALIIRDSALFVRVRMMLGAERVFSSDSRGIEKLKGAYIAPALFIGRNTDKLPRKVDDFLQSLVDAATLSEIDGKPLGTQLVVLFEGRVPYKYQNAFFRIEIDDEDIIDSNMAMNLDKYKQARIDVPSIGRIKEMHASLEDDCRAMYSAITLGAVWDAGLRQAELMEAARKLSNYQSEEDEEEVVAMFRERFSDLASRERFKEVYRLPDLGLDVLVDASILFDDNSIFISNSFFRELTVDIQVYYSVDTIKRCLAEEQILVPGANRYAVKMSYVTPYGETKRICMLRFNRERLNTLGEEDLIDIFLANKEVPYETEFREV